MSEPRFVFNRFRRQIGAVTSYPDLEEVRAVHRSLPGYASTQLRNLPGLAKRLGVGRLRVKDEGTRFGLKAFKALGAAYACYRFLREQLGTSDRPCPPASKFYSETDFLRSDELTFCTATDGNHGRGVAWIARLLGQRAVIFLPRGTVEARVNNIRSEGAETIIVDGTYDRAVEECARQANQNGWQMISDTSWPGYEKIPTWIQDGYSTLFQEIDVQLDESSPPDVVIVPGGVGALAAAAAVHYNCPDVKPTPRLISVEPVEAACLLESIASSDGNPVESHGRLDSLMAGLNCGIPSPVAWTPIRSGFDAFVSIPDRAAVDAMRHYYRPIGGDPRIIAGESGAATLGGLVTLVGNPRLGDARKSLGLNRESSVLLLMTEADTDPENFRRLVIDPTG